MFSFQEKEKEVDEDDLLEEDFDTEIIDVEFNEVVSWLQKRLYLPDPIGPFINDLDKLKDGGRDLAIKEEWWNEFCENEKSIDSDLKQLDVFICKVVFEEIKKRENTILFKSPLFKTWRDLIKLYEEKKLYIAESAFSFVKLINFEIPFYERKHEKNQKKIETARREITKHEQSLKKSHSMYVKLFQKYKIEKIILDESEITGELKKSSKRELPKKVTRILNVLVTENSLLNDIIKVYSSYFKKVSSQKTKNSKVCTSIQKLLELLNDENFQVTTTTQEPKDDEIVEKGSIVNKPENEEVEGEEEEEKEENENAKLSSKSHTFFEEQGEDFYNDILELQGFLRNSSELPHYDTTNLERKVEVLSTLELLFKEYEEIVFILASTSFQKRITKSFSNIKMKIQMIESYIDDLRKRIAVLREENEEFVMRKEILIKEKKEKKIFLQSEILKCLEETMKGKKLRIRITNSSTDNIV